VPRPPIPKSVVRVAVTFAVSAAGGFAATLLGLPAGWLAGGLLAVVVASLSGVETEVPAPVRTTAFFVLGLYAGTGVSHETLRQMETWPASFALLGASLVLLIGSSYALLHRRYGWDRNAALLSALPGALSFVMAAAEQLKVDMKKVAIAQSIRLLMLVELIPLMAFVAGHSAAPGAGTATPAVVAPLDLGVLAGAGLVAAVLLRRLSLPGAWMLGGLLASAALLLGGIVEGRLPDILVVPCTIVLGAIAGSRFRPGDWAILPRLAAPSFAAFAVAASISAVAAGLVAILLGIPFLQALLAFAPGAQEAVVILAFSMGLDPAYVAAHQVVRFLALVALVPFLARRLDRQR
jgi:membrane AbrB-like protein